MAEHRTGETREREIIVTDTGSERSGVAGVVAALLAIAAVVFVVWLVVGSGVFDGADVEPTIPDEVDINIDDGGDGGS